MPELAELRLTADYVNQISENNTYVSVKKNPVHKGKDLNIPYEKFYIRAESRGKELMLTIMDKNSDNYLKLLMTMGMSGRFLISPTGHEHKHSHLRFYMDNGHTLSFVDVRRFGKWKWADDWSPNRGPDPTTEYEKFKDNILSNMDKAALKHPIHRFLMNQKYCNGLGNYLRAEILYRLPDLDPWISAKDAFTQEPKLFELCRDIPIKAYILGGGQLKDWKNPFSANDNDFKNFMRCYGNPKMSKIRDKGGRMFWYDPKWNKIHFWDHYSGLPNPDAYETIK